MATVRRVAGGGCGCMEAQYVERSMCFYGLCIMRMGGEKWMMRRVLLELVYGMTTGIFRACVYVLRELRKRLRKLKAGL